jgi:hypothetical protein
MSGIPRTRSAIRRASQTTPSIATHQRCLKGVVEVGENSPIKENTDNFDNGVSIAIDITFDFDDLSRCSVDHRYDFCRGLAHIASLE